MLEVVALLGEALCQLLHQLGHQLIGALHRVARLVDKTRLNFSPAVTKLAVDVALEQRLGLRAVAAPLNFSVVVSFAAFVFDVVLRGARDDVRRQFVLALGRRVVRDIGCL